MTRRVDALEILDRRAAEAAFLGRDVAALELRDVMAVMAELIEAAKEVVTADQEGEMTKSVVWRLAYTVANIGSAS